MPGIAEPYRNPNPADTLRHEVHNHSEEIRVLYARLATQESLIESLRDDIQKISRASLEVSQGDAKQAQARISDLEIKVDTLERQLAKKEEVLNQTLQRFDTLDLTLDQQKKNSRHLEKSLGTLLEAVGADTPSAATGTYCVAAGDSLEKLARRFKTSVNTLKELNGLTNDRIVVGKKLKVPAAS